MFTFKKSNSRLKSELKFSIFIITPT